MFLASGAAKVVSLDKSFSMRNSDKELKIYQELRRQLDDHSKNLFNKAINIDDEIKIYYDKLRYIYGYGIEEAEDLFEPGYFDFIVSRAVLEEIYAINAAFSSMNNILKPGGFMIHKIDLRDYGIFSSSGMHPLTFLTIPDSIYRFISKDSFLPNRKFINYYREKMIDLKYDAKILITHIVGKAEDLIPHKEKIKINIDYSENSISLINKIRPKLVQRYKNLSDEELLISGIFLVARKPCARTVKNELIN